MAEVDWTAGSGDWDVGTNWSTDELPTAQDAAVVSGSTAQTLSGDGYFETLTLQATEVTLLGDLESFDDKGLIQDDSVGAGSEPSGPNESLYIASSAIVATGTLTLLSSDLNILGEFLLNNGNAQSVSVSGGESFLGIDASLSLVSLDVALGGYVEGDLNFVGGGTLQVDDRSDTGNGAISSEGDTDVRFTATTAADENISFFNDLQPGQASLITIYSDPNISLTLVNAISGLGTVTFQGDRVNSSPGSSIAGTVVLLDSSLETSAAYCQVTAAFVLNDSELTFDNAEVPTPVTVSVGSGTDSVDAGGATLAIQVDENTNLNLSGGAATSTVSGGPGDPTVWISGGTLSFMNNTAMPKSIVVSQSNDTIFSSSGADVQIQGTGNNVVVAGQGSATVNASGASGNNLVWGGSDEGLGLSDVVEGGSGQDTVVGGSTTLLATGGTGDFEAWGASGRDSLVGGLGANLLVGSSGDTIVGQGSNHNTLVGLGGGALIDGRLCDGYTTIYSSAGSQLNTIFGGSGSDVIATPLGDASITAGSGNSTIWAGSGVPDTVVGGSGNAVIVGNPGAQITLKGAGQNAILTTGNGTLVDASRSDGSDIVFADGNGITSVIGGGGQNTIVSAGGTLHAIGGDGFNAIFGGNGGADTIIGGPNNNALFGSTGALVEAVGQGSNYLYASGANVTLVGSSGGGFNEIECNTQASNTTIYSGNGETDVDANGQSATLNVDAGWINLNAGNGEISIVVDTGAWGTLTVTDFNPLLDTISIGSQPIDASPGVTSATLDGSTFYYADGETIVLQAYEVKAAT